MVVGESAVRFGRIKEAESGIVYMGVGVGCDAGLVRALSIKKWMRNRRVVIGGDFGKGREMQGF